MKSHRRVVPSDKISDLMRGEVCVQQYTLAFDLLALRHPRRQHGRQYTDILSRVCQLQIRALSGFDHGLLPKVNCSLSCKPGEQMLWALVNKVPTEMTKANDLHNDLPRPRDYVLLNLMQDWIARLTTHLSTRGPCDFMGSIHSDLRDVNCRKTKLAIEEISSA